jgi:hypothetical protein
MKERKPDEVIRERAMTRRRTRRKKDVYFPKVLKTFTHPPNINSLLRHEVLIRTPPAMSFNHCLREREYLLCYLLAAEVVEEEERRRMVLLRTNT